MKLYRGEPPHHVVVETPGHVENLQHFVRHSPTGFSWGYGGSGPSDLARCILLDHFGLSGDDELPVDYQAFKADIIEPLEFGGAFELRSDDIALWVEAQ